MSSFGIDDYEEARYALPRQIAHYVSQLKRKQRGFRALFEDDEPNLTHSKAQQAIWRHLCELAEIGNPDTETHNVQEFS